jgi:RHS repeat-associated protein
MDCTPRPDGEFTTAVLFLKTKNSKDQNTVAYYHHDHLGTPIQATDRSGIVVWSAQYNAFGKASITTPTATEDKPVIESSLRFPGQTEDAETGLYYNWHRYYDPELGRYVTADPIGLDGGVNFYAYVGGNPVYLIDPLGNYSATLPIYRPLPVGPVIGYCLTNPILCTAVGVIVIGIIITNPGEDTGDHSIAVPDERPWRKKKGRWKVYVRCNIETFDKCSNCPETIGGWGYGGDFGGANANAQHDANENLSSLSAKGCYKRHCDPVSCFENGRPTRCPRSGRTEVNE